MVDTFQHLLAGLTAAMSLQNLGFALIGCILGTLIGWRPTRPLLGYSGSITPISRAQGTMRSITARNISRRVRFFFIAYSALAKLRWLIVVLVSSGV